VSIYQGQTTSFKVELAEGFHAFDSNYRPQDTFMIALYTSAASLDYTTTAYTAVNEISGTGYVAGGIQVVPIAPSSSGKTAYWSFMDATWPGASFTANGALIYNASQSNRSVLVLAFGNDKTASNQAFTVAFPTNGATTSVVRITND
jgi:hypothetical protein